jgi:putative oxidoreductase
MSSMTITPARRSPLDRLGRAYAALGHLLDRYLGPPVEVAARVYLGLLFFKVGYARLADWSSQEFLFEQIHPVPGLPPLLSATLTTAGELVLPVLLWLGLGQRLAALGLFLMTAVIQFLVGQTPEGIENKIANAEHYIWMLGFLLLATRRPSVLTLDHWLCRRAAS